MTNNNNFIPRFSTPLEDYCKAVKAIKTVDDVREIESKYSLILDDARPCLASITDESFPEFKSQLRRCFGKEGDAPTDEWMTKFGAIALPELFIKLAGALQYGMGSGFVMNRLLDEKLASIQDGRFVLHSPINANDSTETPRSGE